MAGISFSNPCVASRSAMKAINSTSHNMTLSEALSDPLVRSVMAADGVDPRELTAVMQRMAHAIDRHAMG